MTPADLAAWFVRRAIAEAKLSKAELARRAGVTRENVWIILNRRRKHGPRVDTLVALLGACGFELRMEKKHANKQQA